LNDLDSFLEFWAKSARPGDLAPMHSVAHHSLDVAACAIRLVEAFRPRVPRTRGAAYVPETVYPTEAVTAVGGDPASWTPKRNRRFFCPDCGTRLVIEGTALKLRGLPHYRSRAPRFGGSGDRVDR